ncbi:hypothetical protein [Shewanella sp. Isolate11]|uniref:hypothetical protein n=1 Tax=Shewanella sp. Isolate11 TaxID=2908530 RepID=UPI001EFC7B60|nr:hypothetical protein [Shewanella sp. Isolate11]MCG9696105.1 hypothetical protein [Shewanella sp. Isolate11]
MSQYSNHFYKSGNQSHNLSDSGASQSINTYTISARGKADHQSVMKFLRHNFAAVPLKQVESIFGFVERSTLYGGRFYLIRQLSDRDVGLLADNGIGVRIPLTNHFATQAEFDANRPLLAKYHHPRNSIICTNDDLAYWIKQEYPDYDIEASVIKNLTKTEQIEQALSLYDTVVLPMVLNDNEALLSALPDKQRIRLFANAGCAYTCPARICYKSISKFNKGEGGEFKCSQDLKHREMQGMVDFDLQRLSDLGFHKFKLLRARVGQQTGY